MADDLDLDLDQIDNEIEQKNKIENRIKSLSEKVKLTAEERDAKDRLLQEQSEKTSELQRERDFYAGFADVVSTNPAAKDHKDDILAKVKTGYSVEDATYAVLGRAGKLGQSAPTPPPMTPAGGSAINQFPTGGSDKPLTELSRDEKRAKLLELELRGDIGIR